MIDVANRAHIHVRLGPLKFAFCHFTFPSKRTILRFAGDEVHCACPRPVI
jgi:hypothetical protein